jgi:hypothetical protein
MMSIIMYILFISILVGYANSFVLRLPRIKVEYTDNKYLQYAVKALNQPLMRYVGVSFAVLLSSFLIRYWFNI